MLAHAREKRWISPVESRRSKEDPDIQLDKSVFSAAVDRILSLWDKENDPQVKFDSLRTRYSRIKDTGSFDSVGYVFLDEVIDNDSVSYIDVLALRRKFASNIWIDKTSKGRTILKIGQR